MGGISAASRSLLTCPDPSQRRRRQPALPHPLGCTMHQAQGQGQGQGRGWEGWVGGQSVRLPITRRPRPSLALGRTPLLLRQRLPLADCTRRRRGRR